MLAFTVMFIKVIKYRLAPKCIQVHTDLSFFPGFSVDKYGRRTTIILTALLFTLGALLMSFTSSFLVLLVGRFILGFAVSLSAIAECIYISEISTPDKRGMLVSLNELGEESSEAFIR